MTIFADCEDSLRLTRRGFLGAASAILSFAALPDLAFGQSAGNTRLLVVILRGGMDGVTAIPPIGDKGMSSLRKHIVPDDLGLLDGYFAIHPALKTVADLYAKGQALVVHGTSFPYTGRSHFEGQDIMEAGTARAYTSRTGWLGRALDVTGYKSVAMSLPIPLILRGAATVDTSDPSWNVPPPRQMYEKLQPLWASDPSLDPFMTQILAQRPADLTAMRTTSENSLNDLAAEAGRRLAMEQGPRVAILDHVGFDTHSNQPNRQFDRLREIDDAIATFKGQIGAAWSNTLVVTLTEFGRTVAENGSNGTDHGYGTAILVMGGKLKKSGIVADWPGLAPKNLYEGRDLMATLDARSLYGAILSRTFDLDPERVRRDTLEHQPTDIYSAYI